MNGIQSVARCQPLIFDIGETVVLGGRLAIVMLAARSAFATYESCKIPIQ